MLPQVGTIAPLGTKEQLVATLEQVRDDAQEMLRFGGAVKQELLAEIEGWKELSPDGKNDRGLEIFAQLPAPTPGEHTDRRPVPPRTQQRRRSSGSSSMHRA